MKGREVMYGETGDLALSSLWTTEDPGSSGQIAFLFVLGKIGTGTGSTP